jgi:acyl-CoA synthetase (NDP forming)
VAAELRRAGLLVVTDLSQAVRAVRCFYRASSLLAAPAPRPGNSAAAGWLAGEPAGPLAEAKARHLLAEYGIAFVTTAQAKDPAAAATQAEKIGLPVVLKGDLPGCLHKTERGLVRVGLRDAAGVEAAAQAMAADNPGLTGFQLQRVIRGMEFILGVASDAKAGAALLLGFGGIFAEAMSRKAIETLPIDRAAAEAMIATVDPKGLLGGYRTGRRYDSKGLIDLICGLSELAAANAARIAEIDLNPVIVSETDAVAVDVMISLR